MNRTVRFVKRFLPLCSYAVEFLGPAATFGRGFAGPGLNEFFLLQPIETSVNGTDGDILFHLIEQFLTYGCPISAIVEPQNHQQQ